MFPDNTLRDPVGTIKIWTGGVIGSYIPPGWRLCDGTGGTIDLRGRFIMGLNTDAGAPYDESAVNRTGGYRKHGETENHHAQTTVNYQSGGSSVDVLVPTGDTDNRPRFYVLRYIQRVEPWSPAG